MYSPSDSWGKFGKKDYDNLEKDFMDYLQEGDFTYAPLTHSNYMELATTIMNVFNTKSINSMTQLELMNHLLEGIKMPVKNPKTGEQDYVDISLVSKIVVDAQYVEEMSNNNKIKVDMLLSGDTETNKVTISLSNKNHSIQQMKVIELQEFEEMLFKALNEVKDQRLEDVESFHALTDELMNKLIEESRQNQNLHLARIEQDYFMTDGIGIIRDIKTNQEVGTFEWVDYVYNRTERIMRAHHIILSGRTWDDLKEKDRFEFAFYSLDRQSIYSFMMMNRSAIHIDEENATLECRKFDLIIEEFNNNHTVYNTVEEAQEKKTLMDNIDENHPLYAVNTDEFRASRLAILEESKNRQKQEKLVSQFADIDLEF